MSHIIIDRRKNDKKKSSVNRSRYMRRVKEQIRESIKDLIKDDSITDNANSQNKKIKIKRNKSLDQPDFHHDKDTGITEKVLPGNDKYSKGDKIPREKSGQGSKGKQASDSGEGEDDFEFLISKEEFLDIFFEDLELPDMVKKELSTEVDFVKKRSGFSVDGNPSQLNVVRTLKQAKGRRFALRSKKKKELENLENQLHNAKFCMSIESFDKTPFLLRIATLEERIKVLKKKIKAVPFVDDLDLRYNRWDKFPNPTTQAVMFGIMDVSGSMGEWEKEMAKRFFILMLLFLQTKYERVEIVWIRHHDTAKEVDEDEFFHSKESGGTIVSTSLELMHEIQKKRYPTNQWNVFGVQISDGDNYCEDTPKCIKILKEQILPVTQYFTYVEVKKDNKGYNLFAGVSKGESDLFPAYHKLSETNKNFETSKVKDITDIYPTFRKLFEKKNE